MCRVLKTRVHSNVLVQRHYYATNVFMTRISLFLSFSLCFSLSPCAASLFISLFPPLPLPFSLAVRPLSRKMGLHFHRETTFAHYEVLRAKPRRPAEWRSRELTLNITRTSRDPSVRTIFILSLSLLLSVFLFLLSPSPFLFVVRANERSFGRKNIRYPPDFRRDDDDEIISRHGERASTCGARAGSVRV